jgi:hypothetical protein
MNFLSVFLLLTLIFYEKYSKHIITILLVCAAVSLIFSISGLGGYTVQHKCIMLIGAMGLSLWYARKEFQSEAECITFFLRGVFALCFLSWFLMVFFPIKDTHSKRYFYNAVFIPIRREITNYISENEGNAKTPEEFVTGLREYLGAEGWKGYIGCGAFDFVVADDACFLRVDLDNTARYLADIDNSDKTAQKLSAQKLRHNIARYDDGFFFQATPSINTFIEFGPKMDYAYYLIFRFKKGRNGI